MSQPGQLSRGLPPREPIAELARRITDLQRDLNQVQAALTQAVQTTAGASNALWTPYASAWSSTGTAPSLSNGSLTSEWRLLGAKVAAVRLSLVAGSTTTFGTGNYNFLLPVAPSVNVATWGCLGSAVVLDDSAGASGRFGFTALYAGSTTVSAVNGSGTRLAQTGPMTWAVNDSVSFMLCYPID